MKANRRSGCGPGGSSGTEAAQRLIGLVRQHADSLLLHAADPGGDTPLLANALDPLGRIPVRYDPDHISKKALLASPASQQHALKLLAGLSALTGEPAYRERAEAIFRFLLRHLTDRSGLIYWGGHTAYNLETRSVEFAGDKSKVHELKMHYPDYDIMWAADPAGTRAYIEAMWNAHVLDWSRLDFNRHGPYDTPHGRLWRHDYEGGEVFFWGKGLTFVNAGSDLYYAAAMLGALSGDSASLEWAKRLAGRYAETRRPGIGISGYQFSQSAGSWCDGPAVRGDRAQYQIAPLVPEGHLVYEGTLFRPRPAVQRCQLAIAERLGAAGEPFLTWSLEEMEAWGRVAYRRSDNAFVPMLTDGYSLEGLTLDRKGYFGPKGTVFRAMPAGTDMFWMYAAGFRHSGNPELWEMARSIAAGIGAGEIGSPSGGERRWDPPAEICDYRMIQGLLELHRATEDAEFLAFAVRTAEAAAREAFRTGWFVSGGRVATDDPLPLALLRLAAALLGKPSAVPESWT